MTEHAGQGTVGGQEDLSTGELLQRATEQASRLAHDELRLAAAELSAKATKAAVGAGMFGASGVLALLGGAALVAAGVIGLAHVLAWWLSALVVGAALLIAAALVALGGRREVARATPPVPRQALDGIQADIASTREAVGR